MAKIRQAGQTRGARRWISLLAWGAFGLAMTVATGCSNTPIASTQAHDPLHGVMVPPGLPPSANTPKADAASAAPTPQAFKQDGVPAIPASLSSTNPATLAGTSGQGPLGRPTALDDHNSSGPPFLPGQSTLGSKTQQVPGTPGMLGPNPNPKVEQVPDITPANPAVTPTGSWQAPQTNQGAAPAPTAAQPANEELLSKRLQERGVLSQKKDAVPEGVHLTCYVSRGPAGGLRILDATRADYSAAAQAILQKLDTPPNP